ncbi:DNA protecting protein DprA [Vagococcus lutrae LBD1]|uniref:DNA protecting protein DprA n=1 Tax=Vagococcus lutrae LBD1 TaxID=1408226 RepID=V6Q5C7_9ENTE|nr:DNA-processing protein DprA [Vagococcus lutrae]EST90436.1 DNA protecting protein DprA [Vagococcus lutrae LBD1]
MEYIEHEFLAYILKHLKGIGNKGLLRLYAHYDLASFLSASTLELQEIGKVGTRYRANFIASIHSLKEHLDVFQEKFADDHFISLFHSDYPKRLLEIYNPPLGLFYQGDLSLLRRTNLAIIGARDCTAYGKRVVENLVPELIREDMVIVSGLARGIDSIAHRTCLENGGSTIGVIGCGLDCYYPRENQLLQEQVANEHLLISEYRQGTKPLKHHFPARNRIIAGISHGICIIEAKERSGTFITAECALNEGRDVFAVPGGCLQEHSLGCLKIIQEGAKCVYRPQHIIEEMKNYF